MANKHKRELPVALPVWGPLADFIAEDSKPIAQLGFERAMGMRGYVGSPAEREERADAIAKAK